MAPSCRHCSGLLPPTQQARESCPACGQPDALESVSDAPVTTRSTTDGPEHFARYEIVGLLGAGGMGQVYLARDPRLGRDVALKVLSGAYATDTARLQRFRREARLSSALNHPHICTIHDIGEEAGRPFIVMEHVAGQTLAPVEGERLQLRRVLRIGGQVARALAAAHAAGIVHRDIKPSNVMVRPDGFVKVVDFGLARAEAGTLLGGEAADSRSDDPCLTEPGTLVGTVRYMSPEQARGREVHSASDVFSLGVVLYELATGSHPFQADSQAGFIQAILSHTPLSADRVDPQVPAPIAALIHRMLAQEPALRPSACDVASALENATSVGPRSAAKQAPVTGSRLSVGRKKERARLLEAFDETSQGRGQFLCVTGEPGIGKTTLMEDFLAELHERGHACRVARGRCSERLAGTEAYLPVLEALESLLHGEGGDATARTMRTVAPSWYVQVAPLAAEDSSVTRRLSEGDGVSQERLKRELGAFVLELSRQQPLVLLLDDIHWADASTVDLLAYLGTHCEEQRALLVLSYRPTDLALAKHPFGALQLDLQSRGLCQEVALDFLTQEDVEQYVGLTFPGNDFPPELVALIHTRTEGSPLFMADLLRYLRNQQVLTCEGTRWSLAQSVSEIADRLPESVRSMVQRKIEQLSDRSRRLLVAASVQGYEFDSAVVAEALDLDAADVEDHLGELEGIHAFVCEVEERELPDRSLTLRYRFVHVLYQNALFAMLRPTRRAALSRAVADALVQRHGEEDAHVAAELALLFENARDFERATHFFLLAARHAVRRFANHEAAALARRGLDLIEALPASDERDRKELALLVTLGPPLKDTKGWRVPEVQQVYVRANELCERIGGTRDLFPALWGMWMNYSSTGDMETLRGMGERLMGVAKESQDPELLLQANHALATTHYIAGDFSASLHYAETGLSLYDPVQHADHAFLYGGHDPGSCCGGFASGSLWMLGFPERALERGRATLKMALKRGHPVSLGLTHWFLGVMHQLRGEAPEVRRQAEACQQVATDQGAPIFPAFLLAWADAEQEAHEVGLERMRATLAHPEKIPIWWQSHFYGLMAEVLGKRGRFEEALASIATAFEVIGDREIGGNTPELHRLEGVFLSACRPPRDEAAERAIRRAIELARRQKARMLELRALVSLGNLYVTQGRQAEILPELSELYGWFTEGFDTTDLREARALLGAIS